MALSERKDVKVTVVEQDVYAHGPIPFGSIWDEGSLKQLIDALRGVYKSIPKEFRKRAHVEIASRGGHDGSHHAIVTVGYRRPETDEERAEREAAAGQSAAEEEARAREQYEALRQRFENAAPPKRRRGA